MRSLIVALAAGSLVGLPSALAAQGRGAALRSPPPARVVGEFRGYHDGAFEYSGFVPCRDRSGIPAAHPVRRRADSPTVWMTVVDTAGMPGRPWPTRSIAGPLRRYERSYVRVRGTLDGPGRYGHFGEAEYELRVDSVLAVARTAPRGC